MIDSGKRVVVFMDRGPDTDTSVPYLLYEFSNVSACTLPPCTLPR